MKKTGLICLFLVLSILTSGFSFFVSAEAQQQVQVDSSVINGCRTIDAEFSVLGSEQLITNTEAALLFEVNSGTLMYSWNPDMKMYPASLVKIMTALIAVEQGNLEDIVTVTADVIDTVPVDAVSSELQPDEQISLENLLYCMMVDSANDAAAVIADHISGSQEAFVQEMNRYAAEMGCTGTQFVNVHGLHDDEQYTTARDAARILTAAIKNDKFLTIFSTVNYTVPATNKSPERVFSTSNYMLSAPDDMDIYLDDRVIGGRTGVTENGDRCLAVYAEANGLQLISVVMGAKSVYEEDGYKVRSYGGFKETSTLLDYGFDGYKQAQILYANQALRQSTVVNGDNYVVIGPDVAVSTVLPADAAMTDLSFRYYDISGEIVAPVEKGQKLSFVEVWYGNLCVAQADLYAMNTVKTTDADQIQIQPQKTFDFWPVVLTVLLTIIVCGVIAIIVIRFVRRMRAAAARKRSRRYRRDRRRSR